MTDTDSDGPLVSRARDGDSEAFEELVRRHQRLVTSVVSGMMQDTAKTEDVVQDAFLAAWKGLSGFRGAASFKNWLCRIAVNKANSALRWNSLRRWVRLDQPRGRSEREWIETLRDTAAEAEPERVSLQREQALLVRGIIAQLPLQQRTAVLLRGNGLSVEETAKSMGVAEGTVKAHLHHARERFNKALHLR